MTLAQKILQLKKDIDAVYQAGVADGGGTPPSRVRLVGKGYDTLDLIVKDNTIYHISQYLKVNIGIPIGSYAAYLYIDLPNADGVKITLPDSLRIVGDSVGRATKQEKWELSMDSSLGTIVLNTSKVNKK